MPLTPMRDLLRHAEEHRYAVGYFEAWNPESLLAVKDAAVDGGQADRDVGGTAAGGDRKRIGSQKLAGLR